jgi:hypothetical protein
MLSALHILIGLGKSVQEIEKIMGIIIMPYLKTIIVIKLKESKIKIRIKIKTQNKGIAMTMITNIAMTIATKMIKNTIMMSSHKK